MVNMQKMRKDHQSCLDLSTEPHIICSCVPPWHLDCTSLRGHARAGSDVPKFPAVPSYSMFWPVPDTIPPTKPRRPGRLRVDGAAGHGREQRHPGCHAGRADHRAVGGGEREPARGLGAARSAGRTLCRAPGVSRRDAVVGGAPAGTPPNVQPSSSQESRATCLPFSSHGPPTCTGV